jgi:sirohydrochlorin ferrochelatase
MNSQVTSPLKDARDIVSAAELSRSLLIICAHGSAYHLAANEHVQHIAETLAADNMFVAVQTVFQAGQSTPWAPPEIDKDAYDQILIVPYMMSDGFLAKQMINKTKHAIEAADIAKPVFGSASVGTHSAIADLALKVATDAAAAAKKDPTDLSLVMVAHGSKNAPQSRLAAEMHLQTVQRTGIFRAASLAFIEEAPFVADVLRTIDGPAVVVGLFAAPGGHAIVDIAEALDDVARDDLINAGPIGLEKGMHNLIPLRAFEAISA